MTAAWRKRSASGPDERVAGFVYVGTSSATPADRDRPDIDALVTRWTPPSA